MILRLLGHDYKYAVEQIMLMLFPNERPDYSDSDKMPSATISMSFGAVYAQAVTVINTDSGKSRGISRIKREKLGDKLERDRLLQRLIKQSFYKAALPFLQKPPVWGALTGIRPAKLMASLLESGATEAAAEKLFTSEYYVSPERTRLCKLAARAAMAVKTRLFTRDIALYVGIPFCPTRCAYCSFVSNSVEKSFGLVEPFLDALNYEIDTVSRAAESLGLRVVSVYLGGGTPTVLSAFQLGGLMEKIANSFDLSRVCEYTVEAGRPDTITAEKLGAIAKGGATRVSVNPQSMSGEVLKAIGRGHTPEDICRAAHLVRDCPGIGLNMDVIAGLPGDSVSGFCSSLDTVLTFSPENVTVHTLSLKKGSRITLEGIAIPGGAEVGNMLDYASQRLKRKGFSPYYMYRQKFTSGGFENIGWSRHGHEGIYNICMMEELCTVIALGGGGVTKLVSPGGRIERIFNVKYPQEYIERTEKPAHKAGRIVDFYTMEERNGI